MARNRRHPPVDSGSSSLDIPAAFTARKQKILSELQQPDDEYTDKSPKGNVDVQIRDLIDEINRIDGYVTTSSCAGRVAVFVEGGDGRDTSALGGTSVKPELEPELEPDLDEDTRSEKAALPSTRTSPGGKGGGHWLYVSHDPVPVPPSDILEQSAQSNGDTSQQGDYFTKLFQLSSLPGVDLQEIPSQSNSSEQAPTRMPRLVHLSFSPLILHIHCASLWHARPLLSAAINSGFRESGVQSLRVLDEPGAGVMLAIRTAGLAFETVVGVMEGQELRRIVSGEYLAMCAKVVNEKFRWNDARRERLRAEIRRFMENQQEANAWEDEDQRRVRKRREGLLRQQQKNGQRAEKEISCDRDQDELMDGFTTLDLG
jgi:tRNA wybutosine-synthesizing protein 3